ncbi:MAG: 2-oxoacid:acceptor oxidoreductase family protein [Thermodesulfobacteriota bacterium]|nr:2-oxoacid:acceptor oxidoreductase family protein [Thermodesulfobacteriota bacterium]
MEYKQNGKGELLIAGVGGWGIVTIGDMLAKAALKEYKNVAWFPSYATMMRGGDSECCVMFSNERISSPVIYKSLGVMILGAMRIDAFKDRVKPGGLILIEKTGITEENKVEKDDTDVKYVAAMDTATKLGSIRNANLVMLGAYVGATGLITKESILNEISIRFFKKGGDKVVSACKEAFNAGLELV